ncbi:hypothetical protein MOPEL_073_00620 [Mobilicoccus pelagius NBRC 104925]|uniref:YgjP-like metallopeptidase domain-containing protein n=2 Tax=Mobilicoccus TaxID=984996 RepID=H5URR4_9MICO|nr:hypothetical protein MOPEL_073_00620 [Mobilicoccus pelagius NBRC 104925]
MPARGRRVVLAGRGRYRSPMPTGSAPSRPAALRPTRGVRTDTQVVDGETVTIRRSTRRRRTVSGRLEEGRVVVMVPDALSGADERRLVEQLARRIRSRDRRGPAGDAELEARATALADRYLGGRARPTAVRWSSRQQRRWGSCTPATGEIRISEAARNLPEDVLDYVLLHELVHLLVPDHGPEFWAELEVYPALERARGFLDGVAHAQERALTP